MVILKNSKLLKNIRQATHSVAENGMGGRVAEDMVDDFVGFGEVYYPCRITNILSFYDITGKKFPVKFKAIYLES